MSDTRSNRSIGQMSAMNELLSKASSVSNLDRFLEASTPSVSAIPLKKVWEESRAWEPLEEMPTRYFRLADLWKCYDEWSAYGVGVPVVVNGKDRVFQYFVPYLSALQLYTTTSRKSPSLPADNALLRDHRSDGECSDSETSRGEETNDDSESSGSLSFLGWGSCSGDNKSEGWDCASEECMGDRDNSSSWGRPSRGHLYLEYFERAPPFARVPLLEKINQLSRTYPELHSLRSIDLSPASWMSVAWYPIYHIPASCSARDLGACFLTYHTLSFSFQDAAEEPADAGKGSIRLPAFGIATYKLHGDMWLSTGGLDQHRLYSLWTSALSWLTQLQLHHHDFRFFLYHKD